MEDWNGRPTQLVGMTSAERDKPTRWKSLVDGKAVGPRALVAGIGDRKWGRDQPLHGEGGEVMKGRV